MMFASVENGSVSGASIAQDRHWNGTLHACMAEGGTKIHPDRKHWVLEGRLWAYPDPGTPFSLYFAIERGEKPNLSIASVDADITAKIKLPNGKSFDYNIKEHDIPHVPCLINDNPIKKGTKLVAPMDNRLVSATKKMKEEHAAAAAKAKAASKDAAKDKK